ncbi:hypothetical protein GO755_02600 [Spirosoma sp. HMF4905]|uniref:TIR domain-containing protein n=1 Tax=Spirosoma arboris TaxID=2682092 RepID=A0A7K1S503_9BACT|nr:toll/interleukin-1 receptor domain-containing protein [Spirosoma arboris]MVM28907.1 hypothetical protein [Spirosoma arboris]
MTGDTGNFRNYDYTDYIIASERSLTERFPEWAIGIREWKALIEEASTLPENPSDEKLERLQDRLYDLRQAEGIYPDARQKCPRLFISHRQADGTWALRIAYLATQVGFTFWLDILDPTLTSIPASAHKLVIAGIIEMAILNSTHVIAIMTDQTRGSLWVPYEYGRITRLPASNTKAAAWLHPDLATNDFPEYMELGLKHRTEAAILNWLRAELSTLMPISPKCRTSILIWDNREPQKLPSPALKTYKTGEDTYYSFLDENW